jgi:hypothetical protein
MDGVSSDDIESPTLGAYGIVVTGGKRLDGKAGRVVQQGFRNQDFDRLEGI